MKFGRWRDFNALRRARVSFQVTRRMVAPKSSIVYKGNCSPKGGRTIHTLSNFDLHFRDHTRCIQKTFEDRLVGPCLKIVFRKYHVPALRNKNVIRVRATGSMSMKFGNREIFQNIDACEGFRLLNS